MATKYVSNIDYNGEKLVIKDLEARNILSKITKRKLIILGDSYTTGDTSTGHNTPWTNGFINALDSNIVETHVFSVNGVGFSTGSTFNWYTLLNSNKSKFIPNEITDIFIVGGYNDVPHISTLANDIPTILNQIKNLCPNAHITVAFVGNTIKAKSRDFDFAISLYNYECSNVKNVSVITGAENILSQTNIFDSDGYHPNSLGQTYLQVYLAEGFKTGHVSVTTYKEDLNANSFLTPKNGNVTNCTGRVTTLDNVRYVNVNFTVEGSFSSNNFDFVEIGTIKSPFIHGSDDTSWIVGSAVYYASSDNKFYCTPTIFRIADGKLYFQPQMIKDSGFNNQTFSSLNLTFNYTVSAFNF